MTVTAGTPSACPRIRWRQAVSPTCAPGLRRDEAAILLTPMHPRLRTLLFTVAVCLIAVILAWQIAEGGLFSFDVAGVVATGAVMLSLGAIMVRIFRLPVDVIVLGLVLFGYLVGNRGFAQLMLMPGVPLLPAEAALLLALVWGLVNWAHQHRLPFQSDVLQWAARAWLVTGSARMIFDVPEHGLLAIRDFATVYYALFFFISRDMARQPEARRYLTGCLLAGLLLLIPLAGLYELFPRFFLQQLTFRGSPLIYFKGDLLGTMLGAGSILFFFAARGRWQVPGRLLSVALFLVVLGGENRASMLALLVATGLLLATRRWAFPVWQGTATVLALCLIVGLAVSANHPWAERKLHGATDRLRSMVDVQGLSRYQSEESGNKGDNNRFRLVWWKNVIEDTWQANPVFGLGFGADLARSFAQEYYPEADEEFAARSPHNIFITVFGRLGLVGLGVWSWFSLVLFRRTWRALRTDDDSGPLWCVACLVFVSACFGVVLEGPMGAILFWTALGVASAPQPAPPPAA